MKTSYYKTNLALLKINSPELVQKIEYSEMGEDLILMEVHNGHNNTCQIRTSGEKSLFLHSSHDPQQEAVRLIEKFDTSIPKVWFIIGLGLGYHLFELVKRLDDQSEIIVIEKRIDLFKSSLSLFDWSKILKDKGVGFIIGQELEEVSRAIDKYFPDNFLRMIEILKHRPSIRLYPQYYSKIKDKLQGLIEERRRSIQKISATIQKDYGRTDRPPDSDLHPQARNKKSYLEFYEEQGKRVKGNLNINERILDILPVAEGGCLDIGCQGGGFVVNLARKGHRAFGIDISSSYLKQAISLLNGEPQDVQNRVKYLQGWAEQLPFKDRQFQTVLLGEILEHVLEPKEVLGEALRVLSPGGILYISTPAYIVFAGNNPEHVRIFSEKVLMGLLNEFKDLLNFGTIRWYSRTPLVGCFRLSIRKRENFCGK